MRKNYFLLLLLFSIFRTDAQVVDTSAAWAFMGGSTTVGANTSVPAVPGGGFAAANRPRNRHYAHLWVDKLNRIWLFGGSGGSSAAIVLNDVWMYDPGQGTDGEWRWVSGSGENGKHTGTKGGSPSTANIPSARHQGNFWKGLDGKFWIFGGQQIYTTSYTTATYGNDLWSFDPVSEEWTWVDGDLPTAAGTAGTRPGTYPSQTGQEGMPRGRGWSANTVDNAGNLWMFGGSTNGLADGFLGDVWKYDITAGKWYLIWGSATPGAPVDYNGQSVPGTPGGSPGARHGCAFWSDAQGNMWIYGGHNAGFFFSDMWKFDIASLQWTWMSGSGHPSAMPPQNNNDGNGRWGAKGVPSADRYPGKRYGMASFTDKQGRFWLQGGRSASGTANNCKNDLWMFDPQTLQWTWMDGDSTNDERSVAGAVGVQDPSYIPSGRISAGMGTVDNDFNFWLFGGNGRGTITNTATRNFIGDLWRLSPTAPPACTLTAAITAGGALAFCTGDSLLLKANQIPGVDYEWKEGSNVLPVTDDSVWVKTTGIYTVKLADQICEVTSAPVNVNVHALPAPSVTPNGAQAICPGDSLMLKATPANMSYEWFHNGNALSMAVDSVYAKAGGNYTVKITNTATGCRDSINKAISLSMLAKPNVVLNVTGNQPVCAGDSLMVQVTSAISGYSFQWYHNGNPIGTNTDRIGAAQQGNYNVLVTEPVNGCGDTSAQPVSITVNPLPVVSLSPSGTVEICQGDQVQLTAAGSGNVQHVWENTGTAFGGNTAQETVAANGQYYVVVTDNNQCSDSSAITQVIVRSRPSFSVDPWTDTAFCHGNKILCSVTSSDTGLGYQWMKNGALIPSATLDFYEISASGTYAVAVFWNAVSGCADTSDTAVVTVHPLPDPAINYDGTVLTTDPGFVSYQWFLGAQAIPQAQQQQLIPADNGAYSIVVTDSNGCTGTSRTYNVNNIRAGIGSALSAESVLIYPNPAVDGTVFIRSDRPVRYLIYSMDGKKLISGQDAVSIDVSALPEGPYLVRMENMSGELLAIERLVKITNR